MQRVLSIEEVRRSRKKPICSKLFWRIIPMEHTLSTGDLKRYQTRRVRWRLYIAKRRSYKGTMSCKRNSLQIHAQRNSNRAMADNRRRLNNPSRTGNSNRILLKILMYIIMFLRVCLHRRRTRSFLLLHIDFSC